MVSQVAVYLLQKDGSLAEADVSAQKLVVMRVAQAVMVVVLSPWSFCESISNTTVANMVGITCIFYITGVILVFAITEMPDVTGKKAPAIKMWQIQI
jgi:hypothetical protein